MESAAQKPATPARKPRVLMLHEDSGYLDQLAHAMRHEFVVYGACSVADAVAQLDGLGAIDAVIVSQELHDGAGTDLLRTINATGPSADDIIKLIITDCGRGCALSAAGSVGHVDGFVHRTVDVAELKRKVNSLMALRGRERRRGFRVAVPSELSLRASQPEEDVDRLHNISAHGAFLGTSRALTLGAALPVTVPLQGGVSLNLLARVVRTDPLSGGVGLEFENRTPETASALETAIKELAPVGDLDRIEALFPSVNIDDLVLFTDRTEITSRLERAIRHKGPITFMLPHQQVPTSCNITAANIADAELVVAGEELGQKLQTSEPVFAAFRLEEKTYCFESLILRIAEDGASAVALCPKVLFYVDKRRIGRADKAAATAHVLLVPPTGLDPLSFPLIEHSDRGLSFAVPEGHLVYPGTCIPDLRLMQGDDLLCGGRGEVRHVTSLKDRPGYLRVGVELGIGKCTTLRLEDSVPTASDGAAPAGGRARGGAAIGLWDDIPVELVHFESRPGETIVGLINEAGPRDTLASVVILPPAYGKKKEHLLGLAMTICETFAAAGRHVVVLRYDGARRRGESFHDPGCEAPHNQMLLATLSQGAQDLRAAIEYCEHNPRFICEGIGFVTFSLSVVEARLLLRDAEMRRKLRTWIIAMGVPDLTDMLVRVSGGTDRVENHRLGIQMGVAPVFGHRIETNHFLADALAHDLADFQRAREDFAALELPVTWLYGVHDHWVNANKVSELMSLGRHGTRELMQTRLGHAARNSLEALEMFGRITQLLLRRLHGVTQQPVLPPPKAFAELRQAEADRLPSPKQSSLTEYWRRYLLGEATLLGFDVMWYADDYQELLARQLELLELTSESRVADLGAGTGNFSAYLCQRALVLPRSLTVSDLVEDAVKRAQDKLQLIQRERGAAPTTVTFGTSDLELNPYATIADFLAGEFHSVVALAGRLEGLGVKVGQRLAAVYSQRLHEILRGAPIDAVTDKWLRESFVLEERKVIADLNQAARVVRREIDPAQARYQVLKLPASLDTHQSLPFADGAFDRVTLSLVLSYLHDPLRSLMELRRVLAPDGVLVLSSMVPDADFSSTFQGIIHKIEAVEDGRLPFGWTKELALESARQLLNDASSLADLESEGVFEFFSAERLRQLLVDARFDRIEIAYAFGDPPQAVIAKARPRSAG